MKLLSRIEELILIAVWRLKSEAYVVTVKRELESMTKKDWAVGALFVTLDRMTRKGYLDTSFSASKSIRGGRAKRLYRLTPRAKEALEEVRRLQAVVWKDLPDGFGEEWA